MSAAKFSDELPQDRAGRSQFRYPTWQKPLQEVLNQPDLEKLHEKVHAAETAIFLRLQEISLLPGSQDELEALQKACEVLFRIQTQRLKWTTNFGGSSCKQ
jgi:hypothetical protein